MKSIKAFVIAALFMSIVAAPHWLAAQRSPATGAVSVRSAGKARTADAAVPSIGDIVHALRREARLMVEQSFRFD